MPGGAPFGYGLLPLPPLPGRQPPMQVPPEILLGQMFPEMMGLPPLPQPEPEPTGPSPETLLGGTPQPPPGSRPWPSVMGIPALNNRVPPMQGLQLQPGDNAGELAQDQQAFNAISWLSGLSTANRGAQNIAAARDTGDVMRGMGGIGQVGLGFLPLTSYAQRLMQTLPRALGTGTAAGGAMAAGEGDLSGGLISPAQAQGRRSEADIEATRVLQRRLKQDGHYDGQIDGRDGPETRAAMQRARDAAEQAGRIEQGRQEEAKAKREADKMSDQRLQQVERDRTFWQRYGQHFGWPLGFGAAFVGRGALGGAMSSIARSRADRADALMTRGGNTNVNTRVGNVNQFWTEGAPRSAPTAPFSFAPGAQPYSWTSNPQAARGEQLYQPGAISRWGPGATVAGAGALETGASEYFAVGPARQELAAAQAAQNSNQNETNIQRLEAARNSLAGAQLMANIGRGTALGALPAEAKAQLKYAPPRPNISAAESERGALDRLIQPRGPAPRQYGPTPPEGARFDPRLGTNGRWVLGNQILGGPNRWPPPRE